LLAIGVEVGAHRADHRGIHLVLGNGDIPDRLTRRAHSQGHGVAALVGAEGIVDLAGGDERGHAHAIHGNDFIATAQAGLPGRAGGHRRADHRVAGEYLGEKDAAVIGHAHHETEAEVGGIPEEGFFLGARRKIREGFIQRPVANGLQQGLRRAVGGGIDLRHVLIPVIDVGHQRVDFGVLLGDGTGPGGLVVVVTAAAARSDDERGQQAQREFPVPHAFPLSLWLSSETSSRSQRCPGNSSVANNSRIVLPSTGCGCSAAMSASGCRTNRYSVISLRGSFRRSPLTISLPYSSRSMSSVRGANFGAPRCRPAFASISSSMSSISSTGSSLSKPTTRFRKSSPSKPTAAVRYTGETVSSPKAAHSAAMAKRT